jgi:hypothetical protein
VLLDQRVGKVALQAHEPAPVRLELLSARAALAQCLALGNEAPDCRFQPLNPRHCQRMAPASCRSHVETAQDLLQSAAEFSTVRAELALRLWKGERHLLTTKRSSE